MKLLKDKAKFIKWLIIISLYGQHILCQQPDIIVNKSLDGKSFQEFANHIEDNYPYKFYYNVRSLPDVSIKIESDSVTLTKLLKEAFKPFNYFVTIDHNNNIFITHKEIKTAINKFYFDDDQYGKHDIKKETGKSLRNDYLQSQSEFIYNKATIGTKEAGLNQNRVNVHGYLRAVENGEPLIGATLFIKELSKGALTDLNGYYSFELPKGKYSLIINSLDRKELKYEINVLSSGRFDIELEQKLIALDEVTISAERFDNIRGFEMGTTKLTAKNIKEIPVALGEKDIIKVALMLPGVQSVGEGSSGINVRGSPSDQNIFLINNIPIYNASHFYGFFSSFNSDALSDFTLYKNNLPVKFGGRLSSVFEITAKDGNRKKFSARGGISPITSNIMVEGPIIKDNCSYMVSARSTYSNWILKLVNDPDLRNSSARFGDVLANITYEISPNNTIKYFNYLSMDDINYASKNINYYTNYGTGVSWRHLIRTKHIFDLDLLHSNYYNRESNIEYESEAYTNDFNVKHTEIKSNFLLAFNKHKINLGVNAILYNLNLGKHLPYNDSSLVKPIYFEDEKGIETGLYIGDEWDITKNIAISAGVRFNGYFYLGPKKGYIYEQGAPRTIYTIKDTVNYNNYELITNYTNPDYRIALKTLVTSNLSFKFSYNKLHQYLFLLSNTVSVSPTDKWKLCDNHIKPLSGEQYSLGLYTNILRFNIETIIEGYYKKVDNLVEFKDGADLKINPIPEIDVLQGDLDAYGIEFMFKKNYGRLNGWVNYVYSRSIVKVDSKINEEDINFGLSYPANYDKPHAFNLVSNYKFSRRLSLSGNIAYYSGRPITSPAALYEQDGMKVLHYSFRNEYRIPDYFRVDLSINIEGNLVKRKFAHGSWMISVYNLTGRKNPYSVYFKNVNNKVFGYKLAVFGTPVYTITYNFKLGNYAN